MQNGRIMELLQIAINQAWHENILSLPIKKSYGQAYLIIQYANNYNYHASRCSIDRKP
jgi:hypothetical protein